MNGMCFVYESGVLLYVCISRGAGRGQWAALVGGIFNWVEDEVVFYVYMCA